jgi:signal recognition particle subunit SRP54
MQDFLEQIRMIQKMGSLKDLFDKLPFFPGGLPEDVQLDDRELVKIEAMINSMTIQERKNPTVFVTTSWEEISAQQGQNQKKAKRKRADFDPSRVKRIANGSGRKETEVKELLQKFAAMRQMMVQLGASTGLMGKIPGLKQFQQMKRLGNLDLGALMGGGMPGGGGALPGMAGAGGGMPAGLPAGMQLPGMPAGMPGMPPAAAPRAASGTNKKKSKTKRKQAKAARKKNKKK